MAESPAAAAPAPQKKAKRPMILGAAVLLVGAAVGAYLMLKGPAETPAEKEAAAAKAAMPGAVIALDPITINLAEGHYLKMSFALQATADAAEAPDGSQALDIAVTEYTDRKISELSTAEGRAAVKKELTEKIKKAYVKEEVVTVMDLYITSFVMQ